MKTFKLVANITFEAENLDQAFNKLVQHFQCLQELGEVDSTESDFQMVGTISLKADEISINSFSL